ncbi:MAG: deoxyribonucleotide triphosphate pyrophosphatase [Bacteroidota bacterium]|jgi:XTP/dITP diphosphohydrolase|nr:deoxyribonucleotide triphosphate pyrophosphatase [Bacteroidota bacterium]
MKLVFATGNANKVAEIQQLVPSFVTLSGLKDIQCFEEVPETQTTIEGNASQKAFYIYNKYNCNCFADDTGLEIEALNGNPGVLSARYAGDAKNADDNMKKILSEMERVENRKACFKTVISLVIDGREKLFTGVVNGRILKGKKGANGFGYDPIFQPNGYDKSFAEMEMSEKNKISHRAIAVSKLVEYLQSLK